MFRSWFPALCLALQLQAADTPPALTKKVEPPLRNAPGQALQSVPVTLELIFDADGKVVAVKSAKPGLTEDEVLVLEEWRFKPAKHRGRRVPSMVRMEVQLKRSGNWLAPQSPEPRPQPSSQGTAETVLAEPKIEGAAPSYEVQKKPLVKLEAPKPVFKPEPQFPDEARMLKAQGVVHFRTVIGREGKITYYEMTAGALVFYRAVRDAILQWRFEPAKANGQSVDVWANVEVNFRLV